MAKYKLGIKYCEFTHHRLLCHDCYSQSLTEELPAGFTMLYLNALQYYQIKSYLSVFNVYMFGLDGR